MGARTMVIVSDIVGPKPPPLSLQQQKLYASNQAVRLECLDAQGAIVGTGTGFLVQGGGRFFVYTCWHVVTGLKDRQSPITGNSLPACRALRVHMFDRKEEVRGNSRFEYIGGARVLDLPLYDEAVGANGQPRWEQELDDIANFALNSVGIFVPMWHDVVRLELPNGFIPASNQVIDDDRFSNQLLEPGDPLYVVGFPNGYSAYGTASPTPVMLVRHLAAAGNAEFFHEALLDAACAPAMSGGPVFKELDGGMKLVGIYVGSVYTARGAAGDRSLSLGRISPFNVLYHHPMVTSRQVPRILSV